MATVVDLDADLSPLFRTGRIVVGGAEVQLFPNSVPVKKGIQFKAGSTNTHPIYIGTVGVTAGAAVARDGMYIDASEPFFVPTSDPTKLYAIAGAAGQDLYWAAM